MERPDGGDTAVASRAIARTAMEANERVSFRPSRADGSGWNAFPGLRYAPSGAIFGPPYGRECRIRLREATKRSQLSQQDTFMRLPCRRFGKYSEEMFIEID